MRVHHRLFSDVVCGSGTRGDLDSGGRVKPFGSI